MKLCQGTEKLLMSRGHWLREQETEGRLRNCWERALFRGGKGDSERMLNHQVARGHQVLQPLNNVTTEENGFQIGQPLSAMATKCLEAKYYIY